MNERFKMTDFDKRFPKGLQLRLTLSHSKNYSLPTASPLCPFSQRSSRLDCPVRAGAHHSYFPGKGLISLLISACGDVSTCCDGPHRERQEGGQMGLELAASGVRCLGVSCFDLLRLLSGMHTHTNNYPTAMYICLSIDTLYLFRT